MDFSKVILVDEHDSETGLMEKLEAHEKGLLHRAFSVFILNENHEMLLQRRAISKYHSPGLWTNACCSHPAGTESTLKAAQRRLKEELGFSCELKEIGAFTYKASFENGLTEHEFDHVFAGSYNDLVNFNPDEVAEIKWISIERLEEDLSANREHYTFWFHIAYPIFKAWLDQHKTIGI